MVLFERLAEGHAAGIVVVTPNRRLSQALQDEFAAWQAARGMHTWETADLLPFSAFVQRMWDDALYCEGAARPPLMLTLAQEQALWEEIVRESHLSRALLSVAATAGQCRDAWQLCHAWRLQKKLFGSAAQLSLNEDSRAFIEWSARYERATAEGRQTDAARLPDVVMPLLGQEVVRKPRTLVLYGFDILTPQQRDFLDALKQHGVEVIEARAAERAAKISRLEFNSVQEEIVAAASWARARLEEMPPPQPSPAAQGRGQESPPSRSGGGSGRGRIGIVVPDLAQSRSRIQRVFASILQPAFNISLGTPLTDYPLVRDAFLLLDLAGQNIAFEDASRLIRSPFLAASDTERAGRARFDAALRERAGVRITLGRLLYFFDMHAVPDVPVLGERLQRLAQLRKSELGGTKTASQWARALEQVLKIAGFPGERVLDSSEFQTLEKWHQVLAGFAALERVTGRMDYARACGRLKRLAGETLFQPEAQDVPVQVLGILESAGLTFDRLWVMGLSDEAWPLPARPNPFVPIRMQREAGVPHADADTSLELDRRITAGWLGAADEVVASHARMQDDSEFAPSPLIAQLAVGDLSVPRYETLRDAIHEARRIERIEDSRAPSLGASAAPLSGGTGIFRDQAACPFRAFARHRLNSSPLEAPQPGLSPAERGNLLHGLFAAVWTVLKDKAGLESIADDVLEDLLERSATDAIARVRYFRPDALDPRFAELEKERLMEMARNWLAIEKARPDFKVTAVEDKRTLSFGGLTVSARLDRMDGLATGEYVVIDYKTGESKVSAWLGHRPDEPQLLLYALGAGEPVAAVAFAQIKVGDLCFKGLGASEGLVPGVKLITKDRSRLARQYPGWSDLVNAWGEELDILGRSFVEGAARVEPKYGDQTCRNCDQHLFCRIAEKSAAIAGEGGDE